VDPISICLLAAGLVKQIQAGCELYKQAKESFVEIKATADEVIAIGKEVHGFWGQLLAFFGSKPTPKPQAAKPVAKTKKSAYVAVDETQVKVDIVKNLTEFFRLQEQLAAHIREEEEKSQTVYDPDQNLMESALKRVMAAQQMAELEVQIRETMVYQSPPEMGALYSEVFKMREVIQEEQEQARLKQEATRRQEAWRQHQRKGKLQVRIVVLLAALFLVGYLHLWLQILRIKSTTTPPF
jgi:hypothetical protein